MTVLVSARAGVLLGGIDLLMLFSQCCDWLQVAVPSYCSAISFARKLSWHHYGMALAGHVLCGPAGTMLGSRRLSSILMTV